MIPIVMLCLLLTQAPQATKPTLYITPTEDNFEVYLAAAMTRKKVPVTVTKETEQADLVLTMAGVEIQKQSTGSKIAPMRYDLSTGEGRRIWDACRANLSAYSVRVAPELVARVGEATPRYGEPVLVRPRIGQGVFRIAVTDAYGRACAITNEHSLPALEAGHIKPYAAEGRSCEKHAFLSAPSPTAHARPHGAVTGPSAPPAGAPAASHPTRVSARPATATSPRR